MTTPSPTPTPVLDPDKAKDRVVTKQGASLAAGAALLTAVIAAGSALLGSYLSSSAAGSQAKDDFLRQQRISAYSKMLTDLNDYVTIARRLSGLGQHVPQVELNELDASQSRLSSSVQTDRSVIAVIGGTDMRTQSGALADLVRQASGPMRFVVPCQRAGLAKGSSSGSCQSQFIQLGQLATDIEESITRLADLARVEIAEGNRNSHQKGCCSQ